MRKVIVGIWVTVYCVLLAGCAGLFPVQSQIVDWGAIGGSRADATIKLAYEYNPNSPITVPSEMQAMDIAKNRCARWGYTGVEAFGSTIRTCQLQDRYGRCLQMLVSREYQCIGDGDATRKQ